MRFNVRLHNEIPEGFVRERPTDDHRNADTDPHIQSIYHPSANHVAMYGLQGTISASLKTKYEDKRRLLGRRIANQSAEIGMVFDTTFEGYERTASQAGNETMGSSNDPEKVAAAVKVYQALAAKFRARGYECEVTITNYPRLSIRLGDQHSDPLRGFAAILRELRAIEAAYAQDEKPLGDIEEPKGDIKVNPQQRSQPQSAFGQFGAATEGEEPDNKWQQVTQQRMMQGITALTSKYFPVGGSTVAEQQHQLFEAELRDFLSRGK